MLTTAPRCGKVKSENLKGATKMIYKVQVYFMCEWQTFDHTYYIEKARSLAYQYANQYGKARIINESGKVVK